MKKVHLNFIFQGFPPPPPLLFIGDTQNATSYAFEMEMGDLSRHPQPSLWGVDASSQASRRSQGLSVGPVRPSAAGRPCRMTLPLPRLPPQWG